MCGVAPASKGAVSRLPLTPTPGVQPQTRMCRRARAGQMTRQMVADLRRTDASGEPQVLIFRARKMGGPGCLASTSLV